jgi:hypothetical protein
MWRTIDVVEDCSKHLHIRVPPSLVIALTQIAKREMMPVAVFVRRVLSDVAENDRCGGKARRPRV